MPPPKQQRKPAPFEREHYTAQQLTRFVIRDLVNDVRIAEGRDADRPGMLAYAAQCRRQIASIFAKRHPAKVDRYGWPA